MKRLIPLLLPLALLSTSALGDKYEKYAAYICSQIPDGQIIENQICVTPATLIRLAGGSTKQVNDCARDIAAVQKEYYPNKPGVCLIQVKTIAEANTLMLIGPKIMEKTGVLITTGD